jgi:predicted nucleotidyltransferase
VIEALEPGDVLMVTRRDRLARSTRDLLNTPAAITARGDNRPDSDIDIRVEFDPAGHVTVFNYAGLKEYIVSLFDGPVDVVNRAGLKPYVRPAATTDAIYASDTARSPARHRASRRSCGSLYDRLRL